MPDSTIPYPVVQEESLFTADAVAKPYTVFGIDVAYEFDSGQIQLPVAEAWTPGQPRVACEILTLHAPLGRKVVRWTAVRIGEQPKLPHPDPQNSNLVLSSFVIVVKATVLLADNVSHRHSASGEYVYFLRVPETHTEGLSASAPPYDVTPLILNFVGPERFQSGII